MSNSLAENSQKVSGGEEAGDGDSDRREGKGDSCQRKQYSKLHWSIQAGKHWQVLGNFSCLSESTLDLGSSLGSVYLGISLAAPDQSASQSMTVIHRSVSTCCCASVCSLLECGTQHIQVFAKMRLFDVNSSIDRRYLGSSIASRLAKSTASKVHNILYEI